MARDLIIPDDIRIAHTNRGNYLVTIKGDVLGIANEDALNKLKISKENGDQFISFSAYEDLAVKVDPIEEKVRRDMERQGYRFLYKGVDISNTPTMDYIEVLKANGLVDDDCKSTYDSINDFVKELCEEGYKSVTTGSAVYSDISKKLDELIKEKKDMNNNASAVIQDAKTGEITHIHNGVKDDPVDHPAHYCTADLFYVKAECIQVTQLLSFSLGNVIKYIWRLGNKDNAEQEAKKACWYLDNAFKYPVETGREQEALGILSVLAGNDIVDNMKIVLMQDILNSFINGVYMDKDKEIHNRIMNLAKSIKG
jgi:hypothetical protein